MYLYHMVKLVAGECLRRYGIAALVVLVVVSAAVGLIGHLAGGSFWLAAKYCAETVAAVGVLLFVARVWGALTRWG